MRLNEIRELFMFGHQERRGLIVLVLILFSIVCITTLLPGLVKDKEYDMSEWKARVDQYYANRKMPAIPPPADILKPFDPNLATRVDLEKLDLPDHLVRSWQNYLAKGGRFASREAVRKLYGMTDEQFARIEEFLLPVRSVPENPGIKPNIRRENLSTAVRNDPGPMKTVKRAGEVVQRMEINQADSAQLESLPGIGPVLASRIIKYRKMLGGYASLLQLKEVYGMTDELWQKATPGLCADSSRVSRLRVNFQPFADLGRHPYIGFRKARALIRWRDSHGKFSSAEELAALFSADSLARLFPYLSLDGDAPDL